MVSKFDDTKRSCRRRLAGHNERRRKNSNESMGKINPPQGCLFFHQWLYCFMDVFGFVQLSLAFILTLTSFIGYMF